MAIVGGCFLSSLGASPMSSSFDASRQLPKLEAAEDETETEFDACNNRFLARPRVPQSESPISPSVESDKSPHSSCTSSSRVRFLGLWLRLWLRLLPLARAGRKSSRHSFPETSLVCERPSSPTSTRRRATPARTNVVWPSTVHANRAKRYSTASPDSTWGGTLWYTAASSSPGRPERTWIAQAPHFGTRTSWRLSNAR